ncbi:hypothetical protein CPB83DRAFT_888278 [Crepidotus variabilis]|uniref:NAD(P)-binding domain-containing protein n=1 Tax=Crepidotus variabilis TaxID=179855 RepID=A0A9P6ESY2_9AGAR|nr:hypothetical protein CPB83DRAFT_888278 [Crepidotus variabilis]
MPLNILTFGASRNIGYFTSLRLLDAGATVNYLLRSTVVFDNDETIQKYIKAGKVRLIKGDALVIDDVRRAWEEASKDAPVDYLLFSVGGTVQFSFSRGFYMDPVNLVTQSLLNVLSTIPSGASPRLVIVSSTGLTAASHRALPFALKPMYSKMLAAPHKDKVGAERLISHLAGWSWDFEGDGEPGEDIMGPGDWKAREGLPAPGTLKNILIVRPALLSDGECQADKLKQKGKDKEPYRVSEQEIKAYTVSRKDVAHFIAETVLNKWDEYQDKIINIGY